MPLTNFNTEWLVSNGVRKYPLAGYATERDRGGSFRLPQSLLVALYVCTPMDGINPAYFFVRTVTLARDTVVLGLGYAPGGFDGDPDTAESVAQVVVPRVQHTEYATYGFLGLPTERWRNLSGRVTLGSLAGLPPGLYGHWQFDLRGGALDVDCIHGAPGGVGALYVSDGQNLYGPMTGHVVLQAGRNARVDAEMVLDGDYPRTHHLTISGITTAGFEAGSACAGDVALGPPIRRINAVTPDETDTLYLLGGPCIEIGESTGALELSNPCAQPCCGRRELDSLARQIEHLGAQGAGLQDIIERIGGSVRQTQDVLLVSRLGPIGSLE